MIKSAIKISVLASVAAMVVASCGNSDTKKPGKVYMPDMAYSRAWETYSESPITTPEGYNMSARKPVEGTIPRGWVPEDQSVRTNQAFLMSYMAKNHFTHTAEKWQEEYDKAGALIKDPLPYTKDYLDQGKSLYAVHCQVCHGEKGNGDGQLVVLPDGSDGPYTAVPPAYSKRLPEIKDGNIFYSVSYGKGMMGAYGNQLKVEDRWKIIHYIKSLAGITGDASASAAVTADNAVTTPEKK